MRSGVVTFQFKPGVNIEDAEATARLAFLGAGAFHGGAIVQLYAKYAVNRARRSIIVQGPGHIVSSIAALMATYLERELGPGSFTTSLKPAGKAARGSGAAA